MHDLSSPMVRAANRNMIKRTFDFGIQIAALILAGCALASQAYAQEVARERPDWESFFKAANATGTMVVVDERVGGSGFPLIDQSADKHGQAQSRKARTIWVYDAARAHKRYSPASTFKIPHALFAMDAGVVRDEFQVFRWDGIRRSVEAWNRDQDLHSSMRHSVVWVYQQIAKEIGDGRARNYLDRTRYGNADPSGGMDGYWLDGKLAISAVEQTQFLERLYRNALPFRAEHQRLVKDMMIVEAGRDWKLRAKTGWDGQVGWWVGWVETATGPVFFALNIDTPNRLDDLPKREGVTRAILRAIGMPFISPG
jgi:beta-lactamase class D